MLDGSFLNVAEAKIVVAAFFGVLARLLKNPQQDWKMWLVEMLIGIPAAIFLTSLITHVLGLPDTVFFEYDILIGVAYIVSHSSQNIVAAVNQFIKNFGNKK